MYYSFAVFIFEYTLFSNRNYYYLFDLKIYIFLILQIFYINRNKWKK